jgi:hypothetical protein
MRRHGQQIANIAAYPHPEDHAEKQGEAKNTDSDGSHKRYEGVVRNSQAFAARAPGLSNNVGGVVSRRAARLSMPTDARR